MAVGTVCATTRRTAFPAKRIAENARPVAAMRSVGQEKHVSTVLQIAEGVRPRAEMEHVLPWSSAKPVRQTVDYARRNVETRCAIWTRVVSRARWIVVLAHPIAGTENALPKRIAKTASQIAEHAVRNAAMERVVMLKTVKTAPRTVETVRLLTAAPPRDLQVVWTAVVKAAYATRTPSAVTWNGMTFVWASARNAEDAAQNLRGVAMALAIATKRARPVPRTVAHAET